ncbi:DUF2268 domain-containing protein [Thalassobacillus devorans]|uniref:DUF2268 domain-containing protein n=1 Tax=Thalassobacillus devorans TaxID=279813 RepID=UPI000A1CD9A9|nr:DUF2268 domain-containing putative Zn-dependent protease [Thalassobacillus devorans]
MAVKNTRPWLDDFVEACKKETLRLQQPFQKQQEHVCRPVTEAGLSARELQSILLKHGLFEPREWRHVEKASQQMERKGIWDLVRGEYQRLRRKWQGPKTTIYIFPVAQCHLPARRRVIVKSGLSFQRCLFLFLTADVPDIGIKALLAHEYNHICRLARMGFKTDELPLKEVLVMEGLAEYAVKSLYGEEQMSQWVKHHRGEDVRQVWKREFVPALELSGQENHQPYLYGERRGRLPEWIGYQIGYEIIDSYQHNHGEDNMQELLKKPANQLIADSDFPLEYR